MAKIFLDPADSITISNNNVSVFGSTGTESITLAAGVTGTIFDQNTEKVLLSGSVSSFKFVQAGNQIKVYDSTGATLVATVPVQGDADGTALTFTDGTAQAKLTSGVMSLGGTTVGSTAAAVTPATFDTTVKTPVTTPTTPTFSVVAGATSYTEGGSATFTVSLSSAQTSATTVNFALAGTGGATLGTDTGTATVTGATLSGSTLTFPAGIVTATVTVPVTFDSTTETGEGVSLTLSSPSTGTTLGTATASTSFADPAAPTFTLTSDVVSGTPTQEGKNITFTITPSGIVDKDTVLTVNLTGQAVGGITSTASANDFTAAQTVTFKAGDTLAKTTLITVVDDSTTEGIEGYKASLLDNTFTEKASTTGTITDPTTTFVLTGASTVNEDASVTYTVTADRAAPAGGITIPYTLTGNATLGTDYTGSTAATGTITIAAGATTGTLILNAVADNLTEATAENVIVTLGTPSTGNVTTGTVTTAIADTSQGLTAGQVALTASSTSVNEGSAVTYTVALGTAAPAGGLSIPYTLSGTSTLTSDWTGSSATTGNITVAAGATSGTLTITTVADNLTEGSETLINTLGTLPSGYTLVTGKGTTTTTINDTSVTVAGSAFTLTTATDTFTGTAGNDTFAGTAASTSATYTASDVLDGAAGIDTLTLTIDSLGATSVPGTVTNNIEVINARNVSGNAQTIDANNFVGATTFNSNLSTTAGILTFSNLSQSQTPGIIGNTSATNGAVTAAYKSTATSATLNLQNGVDNTNSAVVITGTGVTSTTINSTGDKNNILSLATAATNVALTINATTGFSTASPTTGAESVYTITGAASTGKASSVASNGVDAAVQIGTVNAAAKTIDASGMSAGGVAATLVAAVTSFKGGQGTDEITTVGLTSTLPSIINAGAGTDTLILANTTDVDTSTEALEYAGFEKLDIVSWTADMGLFGNSTFTSVAIGGNGTFSNLTATQAGDVTIYANTAGTFGVKDATVVNQLDTLKFTVSDALTAKNTITLATVTAPGVETINVVATDHVTISSLAGATALTTMGVSGAGNVSITTAALAANVNSAINASAVTGTVTITAAAATANGLSLTGSSTAVNTLTGSAQADALIGGAANDTITGGDASDIMTGGAGTDTFAFADGDMSAAPSSTNFEVITDYNKTAITGDVIDDTTGNLVIVSGATAASGTAAIAGTGLATFNSADNTLALRVVAAEAGINASGAAAARQFAFFEFSGDSYVFVSDGTDGIAATDTMIKLTGITGLTTSDLVTSTGNLILS